MGAYGEAPAVELSNFFPRKKAVKVPLPDIPDQNGLLSQSFKISKPLVLWQPLAHTTDSVCHWPPLDHFAR
jgi:hypothetical protein